MPTVIIPWITTLLHLPVLRASFVFPRVGSISAEMVFPPDPQTCYLTEHLFSMWLFLIPLCHPPPGWQWEHTHSPGPICAWSRPGHMNLSSRGVAEPPGRFLRSSTVPKRRESHCCKCAFGNCASRHAFKSSLCCSWSVNSSAEEWIQ